MPETATLLVKCQKCGEKHEPIPYRARKGDYICRECLRAYQREWCRRRAAKYANRITRYTCPACGWIGLVKGYPSCRPCAAKRQAKWLRANPDKAKAIRLRREANQKLNHRGYAAYRKRVKYHNNLEHYREKWRAWQRWLAEGDVTKEQLRAIYEAHDSRCAYCGTHVRARFTPSFPVGFDHLVPRSKGGRHTASNMVVCCFMCNSIKQDALPLALQEGALRGSAVPAKR